MGTIAAQMLQGIDDWFFDLPPEVEAFDESARQELAARCRAFGEAEDAAGLDEAAQALADFLQEHDVPTGQAEAGGDEATRAAAFEDTPQSVDYLKNKFVQLADRIVKKAKD
jgi:hypothetical protein